MIEPDYDKREEHSETTTSFTTRTVVVLSGSMNPILTVADAFYIVTKNSSFDRNENFGI